MQKNKGKRINFNINQCSSEDPQFPVSQLLQQSPEAKGWQSKRFPTYPQTIVVELAEVSLVKKITILSHQSKIATKIEFEIRVSEHEDWKKLGRTSFDSNVDTNFSTRELKQINVPFQAKFIRLIMRNNHVNKNNAFNQVGIICLCFYGDRRDELPPVQERNFTKNSNEMDQTSKRLAQLQAEKRRAVQHEDFGLAQSIKEEIDRLKRAAQQIATLEQRKQEAIKRENYEDAKTINEEIKRLRSGGQTPPDPPQREQKPLYKQQPRRPVEEEPMNSVSPMSNTRAANSRTPQTMQQRPRPEKREVYEPPAQRGSKQQDDDRPINVKSTNPYEQASEEPNENEKEAELEGLNKQLFDECSQYFSVLDEDVFRHLFSKDHGNREKGIQMVLSQLKVTRSREDFIAACLYIVKNLIDDKVASVLTAVISLMGEMLKKLKPQPNSYNQPLVDYIIQKMGDYLGHNNEKIKSLTEVTFGNFPIYHLTNKQVCYRVLATIGKRDKPPKIQVGRLKMLAKIVKEYQLGKDYDDVIKYAVKYADDKNNDIRVSAVNLICAISAEIGYNAMQPYLKNLRPPIIKSIEEKLDEAGNMEEPQNFDEKPIKTKVPEKSQSRNRQQQLDAGNEFIENPKKPAQKVSNQINQDQICQFCKRVDKRFVQQDYKDMHYFNACPMLIICSECGQGIEISTLTSHLVGQCANSKYYKKCPRCKEAVHQKSYKAHMDKKQCLPAKPLAAANRCPLCHLDINPGVNGWKEHLVDQGCENNPRA